MEFEKINLVADWDDVKEFYRTARLTDLADPDMVSRNRLGDDNEWLVGYVGGEPAAITALAFDAKPDGKPTLDLLYVRPAYGRQGLGTTLCRKALSRFRERGEKGIRCIVASLEMEGVRDKLSEEDRNFVDWEEQR